MIALLLFIPRLVRHVIEHLLFRVETRLLQPDGPIERLERHLRRLPHHARRAPTHVKRAAQRGHQALHGHAQRRYVRKHPAAVNARMLEHLTLGDHIAVWITDQVSRFGFFVLIEVWYGLWILINLLPQLPTWDQPPFNQLLSISNWIQLSLMPLILIAGNLQAKHAEWRAEADYQVNQESFAKLQELEQRVLDQDTVMAQQTALILANQQAFAAMQAALDAIQAQVVGQAAKREAKRTATLTTPR